MLHKFKKIFVISGVIFSLSSCGIITPFTQPVSQGKQINSKTVFKIKPNMTKNEVKYILGSPDIIDTFNPNKFIYIQTYKPHMQIQEFTEDKLVLTFSNEDKLIGISGNYSPPTKEPVF
jgi:outer membrane protein assembly factor BamE